MSGHLGTTKTQSQITYSWPGVFDGVTSYCYPEAIPLLAHRIARELILLFTRVGVQEEVLSDQGTNFMSTNPHNSISPKIDGLIERFNGTLKTMIKKCSYKPSSERLGQILTHLLFLHGSSKETTSFSPFKLL